MRMGTFATVRTRSRLMMVGHLGLALSLVSLAACGTSSGGASGSGPIPIGMLGPLTGPAGFAGQGIVAGATVAIDAINGAGGVMGRKLKLIPGDDHLDPVDAITVAQRQISIDHIVATIGPAANTLTATQRYYDAAHVPVIMWGGDDEFGPITDPLIWRCTPGDSQEGTAMALYAYKAGLPAPGVLLRHRRQRSDPRSRGQKGLDQAGWRRKHRGGRQLRHRRQFLPLGGFQARRRPPRRHHLQDVRLGCGRILLEPQGTQRPEDTDGQR